MLAYGKIKAPVCLQIRLTLPATLMFEMYPEGILINPKIVILSLSTKSFPDNLFLQRLRESVTSVSVFLFHSFFLPVVLSAFLSFSFLSLYASLILFRSLSFFLSLTLLWTFSWLNQEWIYIYITFSLTLIVEPWSLSTYPTDRNTIISPCQNLSTIGQTLTEIRPVKILESQFVNYL